MIDRMNKYHENFKKKNSTFKGLIFLPIVIISGTNIKNILFVNYILST